MVSTTSKKVTTKTKDSVFIYVGPTTKAVREYAIFKGGYPPQLKKDFENFPGLNSLFIDPSKLNDFTKNRNQEGTVENILYEQAKKYFSGVK